MINKKAFEIQFNWIFVLVAGAAILLIFTVIVAKQKSVSETSTKATVLKSVEAIITSASATIDTTKREDIPNSNIEVECNRVSIDGVSKQYQNLILFAPSLVKGDKLVWQTMAFTVPYRATNLLYITSPKVRYIIIGDNDIAKEVNKLLSSFLNKEYYKSIPTTIKNENNYKVKFIVFDTPQPNLIAQLQKIPDSDVTAINIKGDLDKGEIEFYQKSGQSWIPKGKPFSKSSYITKASLLGAIYSDSLENYECNMKNVFSKLKLVTEIYIGKTQKLIATSNSNSCKDIYTRAVVYLNEVKDNSDSVILSNTLDKSKITEITVSSKSLSEENKILQRNSCPLIY